MVPPKKDAFADLFQSANRGNAPKTSNLAMNQQQPMRTLGKDETKGNTIDPFDIFTGNGSASSLSLGVLTPRSNTTPSSGQKQKIDVSKQMDQFDIFTNGASSNYSNDSKPQVSSNQFDEFDIFNSASEPASNNLSTSNGVLNKSVDVSKLSLLDDEFTDAFQEPVRNEAKASDISLHRSGSTEKTNASAISLSTGDHVIAELLDIGFSIDDANEAVSRNGADVQKCVNYIMNKNQGNGTSDALPTHSQARANGISTTDWLNKGVSFFNQTKQTVMKNIDQLVEGQIGSTNKDGMPAWMKSTEKYKDQATEKKYGGEDYGSDSENIDQDEIAKFMQTQQMKDKERAAQRYRKLKESILVPNSSKTPPPQAPSNRTPPLPDSKKLPQTAPKANKMDLQPPRTRTPQPPPRPSPQVESRTRTPAPKPQEENIDLLGLSSTTKTSSLRDSAALNQFELTDFDSAKKIATEAFKSGDYSTSLESYMVCLNKLPGNHELRVVINSNLAVVYKLVGQLKNSLESVNNGLALIEEAEITDNDVTISSKPIKYWYTKLIICKAEVLELLENYPESLVNYSILIQKLGVVDKKITDGRRRVHKIVNPEAYAPPPPSTKATTSKTTASKPVVKPAANPKPKPTLAPKSEEIDPLAQEEIELQIQKWVAQKQDNLRSLLAGLNDIIPPLIAMSDKLRHLTSNELMLPKQVKINYMKVISSIHPDKLTSQCKDNKQAEMICHSVFIKLNKSWDQFKQQENV